MNPNSKNLFKRLGVLSVLFASLLAAGRTQAQTWATNSPLIAARWSHTATLLNNGSVLVAGGLIFNTNGNSADTNGAELYDPASGTSSPAASMQISRHSHVATLLANGQVLISGGGGGSSETYDPPSDTWINYASMNNERIVPIATLLPNGKVLVAGGFDDNNGVDLSSAELYDPNTATWTSTAPMPYTADTLAAALLNNGMVLVCGGSFNSGGVTNAVLYNPSTGTWTNTAPMKEARSGHTATLLASGKVLVEGGTFDNTAEVYDPVAATWTFVASMNDGRLYSDAVLLTNGQVMVMGDGNSDVEIYDPVADTWTLTDSLPVPGNFQTATLVSGGAVVVTGGSVTEFNGPALAVVETFGGSVSSNPTLTVTASPSSGAAPLTVQFISPDTDSQGNPVTDWNWDFGDGSTGNDQSPEHVYNSSGTYFPSLTAHSTAGPSPLAINGLGSITVTGVTLAVTETPESGVVPLTVQFASPGVDSGGNPVTNWNWTFGDGGSSTAQNPSHVYTNIGSYSPTLTAYSTFSASPVPVTGLDGINVYTNPVPAFRILYTFSTPFGSGPNGGLAISANTLFGTTGHGGTNGFGNIFGINTDGTGFSNLFTCSISSGAEPNGGLVLSSGALYGATYAGGSQGGGTVFAVNTNGTGYTNVANLTFNVPSTGTDPSGPVVLSGNTLYGVTQFGGGASAGVVFSVPTNGGSILDLHSFSPPQGDFRMNFDGDGPLAGLLLSGGVLYGTAEAGGAAGTGTVFSIPTNNPGAFNPIHVFSTTSNAPGTNADGAFPFSSLVISGGTLYGTTAAGGSSGDGVVFAVGTNGTPFTNLYSFTGGNDGAGPRGGLTLLGNTLYGTTSGGGASSNGTLFAINTDGSHFKTLYTFTGGADGANPQANLLLSGSFLYGSAASGGSAGLGTVFSFALPNPPLAITRAGTNVILTWSANVTGYTLQSSTHLGTAAAWSSRFPRSRSFSTGLTPSPMASPTRRCSIA